MSIEFKGMKCNTRLISIGGEIYKDTYINSKYFIRRLKRITEAVKLLPTVEELKETFLRVFEEIRKNNEEIQVKNKHRTR